MDKKLSDMTLEELWELFPIILEKHNPAYIEWYVTEREELKKAIGELVIERINHIGSSTVEGLIAKPTIDILLEINCNSNIIEIKDNLINAGWALMSSKEKPDFNMSYCKGYTPSGFAEKVFHLHVRFLGDWNELYFRDYLIEHPEVAEAYGNLKLQLKNRYTHDRDGYTEAKTEFINQYSFKAKEEFGNRYLLLSN